jgi:streptogramin lyase
LGSSLFSDLVADLRGHVIIGYGYSVVDFDPDSESFTQIKLSQTPEYASDNSSEPSAAITALSPGPAGTVFAARLNAASVTRVDLVSGAIQEHPIPESFGAATDMVATGDSLVMTNWIGYGRERQSGSLDLKTGQYQALGQATFSLASDETGAVYGSLVDEPGVAKLAGSIERLEVPPEISGMLRGTDDLLTLDTKSGVAWVASRGTGRIARWESGTTDWRLYQLPITETHLRCFQEPCPPPVKMNSQVQALAVGPDGTVYFSDATFNRVGVVKPPS